MSIVRRWPFNCICSIRPSRPADTPSQPLNQPVPDPVHLAGQRIMAMQPDDVGPADGGPVKLSQEWNFLRLLGGPHRVTS